jgi:hypothetical protein
MENSGGRGRAPDDDGAWWDDPDARCSVPTKPEVQFVATDWALVPRAAAWRSRYSSFPTPPSGRFGHGPKHCSGLFLARVPECRETRCRQRRLLNRHVVALLEVAQQPSGRDTRVSVRVLREGNAPERRLEMTGTLSGPTGSRAASPTPAR